MVTRKGFVVKNEHFPPQKGDENEYRRQKGRFSGSKRRREGASSPKKWVFRPKMVTRKGFVAKNEYFPPQNGDEKGPRRQKRAIFGSKW
ncbi:hypothetical protein [Caldifermentibacillus hisashii]|uniref:hypothetical protein n=1 Tax=Caldifermentibacillus hisashii TaxID=996558 RepID=UPI0031FD2D63